MRKFLVLAGLIILIGTAGASDCSTISFGQMIAQGVAGLAMFVVGVR